MGVLGIGDPARDRWKLQPAEKDLGQTLAVYGLGDGFYLMWPFLGPSTLRDSVGMVGDEFLNPVRYIPPEAVSIGTSAASTVNSGSFHLGDYETLKSASVDPYIAMRETYVQYRKKQVRGEERTRGKKTGRPTRTAEQTVETLPGVQDADGETHLMVLVDDRAVGDHAGQPFALGIAEYTPVLREVVPDDQPQERVERLVARVGGTVRPGFIGPDAEVIVHQILALPSYAA